eukprot:929632-Amphidinium_carterae.1
MGMMTRTPIAVNSIVASLRDHPYVVGGDWNFEPDEFPIDLARGDTLPRTINPPHLFMAGSWIACAKDSPVGSSPARQSVTASADASAEAASMESNSNAGPMSGSATAPTVPMRSDRVGHTYTA